MPAAEFELHIHTPAGVLTDIITDGRGQGQGAINSGFLSLGAVSKVNDIGYCTFELNGAHASIPGLQNDSIILVKRRHNGYGVAWRTEFVGLYRKTQKAAPDTTIFTAHCVGTLHLLRRSLVAYASGVGGKSTFSGVAGESILKTLVTYNATTSATTGNGRIRTRSMLPHVITVATDAAGGNAVSVSVSNENLLAALQKVARVAGGDFDLNHTGGANYQFQWYLGQRGSDRTAGTIRVLFARKFGNMVDPRYEHDRIDEATVALVGGADIGTSRDYVVRTGNGYSSSNDIEVFADARQYSKGNTAGLNIAGDIMLDRVKARESFSFTPQQVPSSAYGLHYFLGDKVQAEEFGITTTHKIIQVAFSLPQSGEEKIDLELETL